MDKSSAKDIAVLGTGTAPAVAAIRAIRAKADDYFARCRLAQAFGSRAIAALNRSETDYLAIAAKDLKITVEEVSAFPLARVEAHRPLPLLDAVNPAWAGALAALHTAVITPVYGAAKGTLTEGEWTELNAKFAPYETWLGGKAGSVVEKLSPERAKALLAGQGRAVLNSLLAQDKALEPEFKAIASRGPPRALPPRPAHAAPQFHQFRRFLRARPARRLPSRHALPRQPFLQTLPPRRRPRHARRARRHEQAPTLPILTAAARARSP